MTVGAIYPNVHNLATVFGYYRLHCMFAAVTLLARSMSLSLDFAPLKHNGLTIYVQSSPSTDHRRIVTPQMISVYSRLQPRPGRT